MSPRPTCAAIADSRQNGPTRRQLVIGSTFAAATAPSSKPTDPTFDACSLWLSRDAESDLLRARWQELESYLFRERQWHRLSRRQRAALPEAILLDELEDQMDGITAANERLMAVVLESCATTAEGLASKLKIAATIVRADENRLGHELIKSALRDLQLLTGVNAP